VNAPRQGDVWWAEAEDKRRPVLVVTRSEAVAVLDRIIVAPLTRTVRDIPTEVRFEPGDGVPVRSAASFDNVQPISRSLLTERLTTLAPGRRYEICAALAALADC